MFNNREALTGNEETSYDNITQMTKDYEPFYALWTTTDKWKVMHKSWLNDDFELLDAFEMEEIVDNADKTMNKCIRQLKDKEVPQIKKIAETVKEAVIDYKQYVNLGMALRTEGMKDRHWEAVSNKVGFEVKPYAGMNFQNLIDMGLNKWSEDIVEIGDRAGKEYNIETSLAKMKKDWEIIEFRLKPFKNSGTYTTLGFDEAQAILDEHMTLAQTMQFSPFKGPFLEEIEEWNKQLLYVSNVMEEWLKTQASW
jgi:dynein heavy chain